MLSSKKRKSSEKGKNVFAHYLKEFLYCECILATLLQNRAQYLKIFVIGKVLNFVPFFPLWSDLLWTCKLVIEKTETMRQSFIIIIYYEVFSYFFPNTLIVNFQQETIAFWRKKNPEAFTDRYSLISGVLQGVAKIFEENMEVNHFLLLSCRLEK